MSSAGSLCFLWIQEFLHHCERTNAKKICCVLQVWWEKKQAMKMWKKLKFQVQPLHLWIMSRRGISGPLREVSGHSSSWVTWASTSMRYFDTKAKTMLSKYLMDVDAQVPPGAGSLTPTKAKKFLPGWQKSLTEAAENFLNLSDHSNAFSFCKILWESLIKELLENWIFLFIVVILQKSPLSGKQ